MGNKIINGNFDGEDYLKQLLKLQFPNPISRGNNFENDEFIYEIYRRGSYFLSSGHNGFMREFINIDESRVVPFNNINDKIASITEFVSVAVHSTDRFDKFAHPKRDTIGIWGDGSLAYVLSCVIKAIFPNSSLVVVGKDIRKLSHFSFVDKTFLAEEIPNNFRVDHVYSIEDIHRVFRTDLNTPFKTVFKWKM